MPKKLRVYNYPSDIDGLPCIWIGVITEEDTRDKKASIVRLRNAKGEVKEDFFGNLQISNL